MRDDSVKRSPFHPQWKKVIRACNREADLLNGVALDLLGKAVKNSFKEQMSFMKQLMSKLTNPQDNLFGPSSSSDFSPERLGFIADAPMRWLAESVYTQYCLGNRSEAGFEQALDATIRHVVQQNRLNMVAHFISQENVSSNDPCLKGLEKIARELDVRQIVKEIRAEKDPTQVKAKKSGLDLEDNIGF